MVISGRNWAEADEDENEADDDDVEIGGATVAQVGQVKAASANANANTKAPEDQAAFDEPAEKPRAIVPQKPRTKRERNIYGDFVVTKINIKDRVIEVPKNDDESEEEESEEESEEEEPAVAEPVEEVK